MRWGDLYDYDALGDAEDSQVAVPTLYGVLLGEAVAAEQLHTVQADLHALVGAEPLGQRGFAAERQTLLGPRRTAPGDQPQPIEFDGDVGAHERNGLPMSDRLAECLALLHIRDDIVEYGGRRADGERGPAQPGQRDRLGVVGVGGVVLAPPRTLRHRNVVELDAAQRGRANAHARVGSDGQALARGLDDEQCRLAIELG